MTKELQALINLTEKLLNSDQPVPNCNIKEILNKNKSNKKPVHKKEATTNVDFQKASFNDIVSVNFNLD